jgi:hypothetical protein
MLRVKRHIRGGFALRCRLFGHQDGRRCEAGRVYLECLECGRETPGWLIGKTNSPAPRAAEPRASERKGSSSESSDSAVKRRGAIQSRRQPDERAKAA